MSEPKRGRPPGTPNPKAGRPKGSKNTKQAQGRAAKESVTILLSKQEKAMLDTVCEFEKLSQREVLMKGIKLIQLQIIAKESTILAQKLNQK